MSWLWWIAGALFLSVIEMLSLSLFLLMLAGGALAAAVASVLGADPLAQFVIAGAVALVLVGTLRPWLLRHLRSRVSLPETNAAALVGREAIVVATVTDLGGRVKMHGEVWTARTAGEGITFAPGETVHLLRIDGATAIVGDGSATHHTGQSQHQQAPGHD